MGTEAIVASSEFALTPVEPTDYLDTLIRQGANIEVLRQFMDLRDREQARQAKLAFTQAKACFAAEEILITKDKVNSQYGSNYTSLGNLVNTARHFLGKHGFDVHWEIDQADPKAIRVTCILTHEKGHSEKVVLIVPPDTSGGDKGKNPLQQIKSAITYARIVTFEAVCGLASTDQRVNLDDDANSAYSRPQMHGSPPVISEEDAQHVRERVEDIMRAESTQDLDERFRHAFQEAHEARNEVAKKLYVEAKDNKRKAFREAARANH